MNVIVASISISRQRHRAYTSSSSKMDETPLIGLTYLTNRTEKHVCVAAKRPVKAKNQVNIPFNLNLTLTEP